MKALKLIRECLDLTQVEAAELVGVSQSYLCEIEAGKKAPSLETLQKYASVLQLPMSAFFFLLERLAEENIPLLTLFTTGDSLTMFKTDISVKMKKVLVWAAKQQEADALKGGK